MSRLSVVELNEEGTQVEWNGVVYEKASWPIQSGDIVKAYEDDSYFTKFGFYPVVYVDSNDYFMFKDDDEDERERGIHDDEFVPYRKVSLVVQGVPFTKTPCSLVITDPVRLILQGDVTIEIKGGVKLATTI